jgi:hypothetical protein
MPTIRDQIEAMCFKRSGDGYVYRASSPWVLGSPDHYFVTEAQKAEILALVTPSHPKRRLALVIIALVLWVGAAAALVWAFGSGQDSPTGYDFLALAGLILVPIFLAILITAQMQRRRVAPLLAALPRTNERITRSDMRRATSAVMSFNRAVLMGAMCAVMSIVEVGVLVSRDARYPLFSAGFSFLQFFLAPMFALLAVRFLRVAVLKRRAKEHRGEE